MQGKDFNKILGKEIPNLLKSVHDLEKSVAPILSQINQNRDKIDPSILGKFDEIMSDLNKTKTEMKQYGNFNS